MYAAAGNFPPVVYLRERQTCRSPPKAIAARIKRSRSRRCFIVYAVAEWAAVRGTVSVRSGESSGRALSRREGEKRGALFGVDAPLFSSRRVASAWKGRAARRAVRPAFMTDESVSHGHCPYDSSARILARIYSFREPNHGTPLGHVIINYFA